MWNLGKELRTGLEMGATEWSDVVGVWVSKSESSLLTIFSNSKEFCTFQH